MADINIVTDGEYKGKEIRTAFAKVFIIKSTFGTEDINDKTVQDFEIVKEERHKDYTAYTISIVFKTGKTSILHVDNKVCEKLLAIWPEKKVSRLSKLLNEGYDIAGFSSCVLAQSGLGAGAISHNILLRKGLSVEKISFITLGDKQLDAHSHIFNKG